MNIKRLCLIAGLLGLPVAYANAGEITINVPVELTNVPVTHPNLRINCQVGSGASISNTGNFFSADDYIANGAIDIRISDRSYRGVVSVPMTATGRRVARMDNATHYKCGLGPPGAGYPLVPPPVVSGIIPR